MGTPSRTTKADFFPTFSSKSQSLHRKIEAHCLCASIAPNIHPHIAMERSEVYPRPNFLFFCTTPKLVGSLIGREGPHFLTELKDIFRGNLYHQNWQKTTDQMLCSGIFLVTFDGYWCFRIANKKRNVWAVWPLWIVSLTPAVIYKLGRGGDIMAAKIFITIVTLDRVRAS